MTSEAVTVTTRIRSGVPLAVGILAAYNSLDPQRLYTYVRDFPYYRNPSLSILPSSVRLLTIFPLLQCKMYLFRSVFTPPGYSTKGEVLRREIDGCILS